MYIKFVNEENKNFYISCWLLLITFLVALMIVVGGLTRLTDSGLSITQWNLLSGILPPLDLEDWENLFNLYKIDLNKDANIDILDIIELVNIILI